MGASGPARRAAASSHSIRAGDSRQRRSPSRRGRATCQSASGAPATAASAHAARPRPIPARPYRNQRMAGMRPWKAGKKIARAPSQAPGRDQGRSPLTPRASARQPKRQPPEERQPDAISTSAKGAIQPWRAEIDQEGLDDPVQREREIAEAAAASPASGRARPGGGAISSHKAPASGDAERPSPRAPARARQQPSASREPASSAPPTDPCGAASGLRAPYGHAHAQPLDAARVGVDHLELGAVGMHHHLAARGHAARAA